MGIRWVSLALLGTVALTACEATHDVTLPPRTSAPAAPSPTGSLSPRDAALQAYMGFTTAADAAAKRPEDKAKVLLAAYAEGDYLDGQIRAIRKLRAKGQEPWGSVVVHVTEITVKKNLATVQDCQDQSEAGVADRMNHQLIPGTEGDSRVHLVSTLHRGKDGRWRMFNLLQLDTPCSPVPSR